MKNARNLYTKDSRTGFTIVELIVIIVVIVILASIVIVSYTVVTKQSQLQTAKGDAQTAGAAINKYRAETGSYPTALSQVTIVKTQSDFTLVMNSGGTGKYCIESVYKGQTASVKQGTTAAEEGPCPPSGATSVTTITNLANFPSAEADLTGITGYAGGVPRIVGGSAVSGAASYAVTTDSDTSAQGIIHYVTFATVGRQYTCSMSFKGTDGVVIVFANRFVLSPGLAEGAGARSVTLSSTNWTRKTITATAPANATQFYVQYKLATAAAGVTIQADALICTQGATDYEYADGDSAGWSWAGTRHKSGSSGPATAVAPAN